MKSRSIIVFLSAGISILLLGSTASAHHVAFCQAIIQAVEKPDLETAKVLFEDAAWSGVDGNMSATTLQERLKTGKLVPLLKSSDAKFKEYSSYDKFDSRLRCILTFSIRNNGHTEQVYLLAKRIKNDGFSNPKAWRIWRIVTDKGQAECFLGRTISREE
ncbi:MAG: hypothetical protein HOH16_00045 [Planctomycetaceae bacterium]|nr:hypothetical protein [Planctomycetaceae bacterium]